MSGGFFRGTSADQDTRFSNKQAKLMKSQKFAPELEHLVDMTKVNMDVMRPWIATRVTELLGFEDEVLINFIYGLLDVKEANGKEIQISLTGFMEKNTVKFMKELWTHLLSAQNNASGVPQQFLDAKQEEARKKKEEADAIETQRKKDKEVLELERSKKMEGGVDKKPSNGEAGPSSYRVSPRASSDRPDDERGTGNRNGVTARNRVSRSPLPPIDSADSDSSLSPRFGERDGSSSVSKSPEARGRSISSERGRGYRSPQRRPISSRRRSPEGSLSPRGRSPHSRRGSRSNSPHRSRSPVLRRVRSPYQRRSRSPGRRRSPPPFRSRRSPSPFRGRRSPYRRRRSPSPLRRRRPSPVRNRRSPSPIRRRRSPSPLRRRLSPIGRRRRSPSPARRRSPSPVRPSYRRSSRNRYASPVRRRSPVRSGRRSPPLRRRSPSPSDRSSSSPVQRDSPSPVKRTTTQKRSPLQSHQERTRSVENLSPASQQSSGSEGSLQRESKNGNNYHKRVPALSPSPQKSPLNLEPSPGARSLREKRRRLSSPSESPAKRPKEQIARYGSSSPSRKPREQKLRRDSPKECEEEDDADHRPKSLERRSRDTSGISKQIISPAKIPNKEEYSPERVVSGQRFTESQSHLDKIESRNQEQEMKSGKSSGRGSNMPIVYKDSLPGETQRASNPGEGKKADDKNRSHSKNTKDSERHRKPGSLHSSVEMVDHSNHSGGLDSGSEDSDKGRSGDKEKRKNKRSEKQEVTSDDDDSYDSAIEDRKEAKKRRKEEKRLRKEKKRRRREERRRRREERRAEKQKVKNSSDASGSDGEHVTGRGFHSSDNEEEAVQKKLEIELRKKALESLKAKKGISQ